MASIGFCQRVARWLTGHQGMRKLPNSLGWIQRLKNWRKNSLPRRVEQVGIVEILVWQVLRGKPCRKSSRVNWLTCNRWWVAPGKIRPSYQQIMKVKSARLWMTKRNRPRRCRKSVANACGSWKIRMIWNSPSGAWWIRYSPCQQKFVVEQPLCHLSVKSCVHVSSLSSGWNWWPT